MSAVFDMCELVAKKVTVSSMSGLLDLAMYTSDMISPRYSLLGISSVPVETLWLFLDLLEHSSKTAFLMYSAPL
jgi:hypothetical protein